MLKLSTAIRKFVTKSRWNKRLGQGAPTKEYFWYFEEVQRSPGRFRTSEMDTNLRGAVLSRRQLLQAGCGGLGLALLGGSPAQGYTPIRVDKPAKISGIIRYAGQTSHPQKLKLSGDCAYCRKFDLRAEELLASPQGVLRNVVVFLEGIRQGKEIPSAPLAIAEKHCTFVPHVLSITVGSKLLLHNQDPVLNTFHAVDLASGRTLFNIGLPNQDQKVVRRIRQEGLIKMLCDVHPWEVAYLIALSHPYHTVSDHNGAWSLDQVPPGVYTLAYWHEKLGLRRQQRVEVRPGAQLKLVHTYPGLSKS